MMSQKAAETQPPLKPPPLLNLEPPRLPLLLRELLQLLQPPLLTPNVLPKAIDSEVFYNPRKIHYHVNFR